MEHFGLGRYGDPVNYNGHLQGLNNLRMTLKRGGIFYLSVPVGPLRLEFNADRVLSIGNLLKLFARRYFIDEFSFVEDQGALHENVPVIGVDIRDTFGC